MSQCAQIDPVSQTIALGKLIQKWNYIRAYLQIFVIEVENVYFDCLGRLQNHHITDITVCMILCASQEMLNVIQYFSSSLSEASKLASKPSDKKSLGAGGGTHH